MAMMKTVDLICDEVIEQESKGLVLDEFTKIAIKTMILRGISETLLLLEGRIKRTEG